jgi:hypothetical protein
MCIVCADVEREVVLMPCSHVSMCSACTAMQDACPICRGPIEGWQRVRVHLS